MTPAGRRAEAIPAAALALALVPAAGVAMTGVPAPDAHSAAVGRQAAAADSSELDARTARVADQLRCPVCRSQSVLESSSTLARQMKAEIRRRLSEGQTPEQVKAYFVSRYGEWILLRPEAEGLNLVVYVLPPLLLVGGGLLVWVLLRRWSPRGRSEAEGPDRAGRPMAAGRDAGPPPDGEELSEEEVRRLEEAMREGPGG